MRTCGCTLKLFNSYANVPLNFPDGSVENNLPANVKYAGSIPGSGRSPAKGKGSPLQYSCLENPMDRGAWQVAPRGHKEPDATKVT